MDQNPENNGINLDDILLPKKEVRTPASAERVNAGVLLEGEQKAELPKQEAPKPIEQPKPEGPVDTPAIAPLETYQRDMDTVISQKNISAVSIAAAEAERASRAQQSVEVIEEVAKKINWKTFAAVTAVVFGIGLVVAAAGLLAYVLTRGAPSVSVGKQTNAPFMAVDDTQVLVVKPEQFNHDTLMQNLERIRENTSVSLGLVSRAYVVLSSSTIEESALPPQVTSQELLSTLAPNASDALLRTLDPSYYLLGTHVYDGNQEFLVLKVDSYEQAFSGMLDWERTMATELSPLFIRIPRPKTAEELSSDASSTPAASLISTQFQDKIVANHDARVVLNDQGDIVLLWAFIDRNTLVITNNESTLSEIISRSSVATGN